MDYRKYLTEDILPFWIKNAVDDVHGGIMTQLDKDGNVYCEDKNVWFIGRSMWTYAVAYNTVEPRQEYLDMCEQLYQFYKKCQLPDGRLAHITERDGTAKKISPELYHSEMHAVMGLAQYYKACKKEEVWQLANRYYDTVEAWYRENRSKKQTASGIIRGFGPNLLVLSMAQFIRNVGRDAEKYDELAKMAIDEMMHGGYVNDEYRTVFEKVSENGEVLSKDGAMQSCPGHVFEAAWFVMCEGEVKNNDEYRAFGRKLCDYAMPDGFEKVCRLIPTMRDVKTAPLGKRRDVCYWWPQCEAVIAYRLAHNIFGDKKYLELAKHLEVNAFNVFADFKGREWYSEATDEGEIVNQNKGSLIKGPFHLPRMLLGLISLEETGSIHRYMQ